MIFAMKIGFAMLEVGSVREKNTSNILLKNSIDFFVGVTFFYLIGYAFKCDQQGGVIGNGKYAGVGYTSKDCLQFLFDFSFCATSTTIVSGSMAERVYADAYLFFSILMTGVIYPISSGWAWNKGWLYEIGFLDYSGSGIVHLVGGVAGLIGTVMLGPRLGIFEQKLHHKQFEGVTQKMSKKTSDPIQNFLNDINEIKD